MKNKPNTRIRCVREEGGWLWFLRSDKPSLRSKLLRLLFGSCLHVLVITPGNCTSTVSIHREDE